MKEEQIDILRQQDVALRDALKLEEAELPQLPADLNVRLMQRVADVDKKPRRIIWPWLAAACVAGVLMLWLTPPKEMPQDVVATQTVVEQPPIINNKVEENLMTKVETEEPKPAPAPVKSKRAKKQKQPVVEMPVIVTPDDADRNLAIVETGQPVVKQVILTEHDIPITRPENYKYTPEELALLRKQADEAYLKWVELELEISKNNLQQTAQQE